MKKLPVIVGHGGINAAGRGSFNHAYNRTVIDKLSETDRARTYASLAALMQLDKSAYSASDLAAHIDSHTLVRKIERFDTENVLSHRKASLGTADDNPTSSFNFVMAKRDLPEPIPAGWQITDIADKKVAVSADQPIDVLLPEFKPSKVRAAGQVPTGFDPGNLYQSRNHPRGLQLAIFAASDALRSSGIDLATIKAKVAPDRFAVYSGSAMGQLDNEGYGGLFQNSLTGRRVTSKNVPLGLPEMPGDFINAYILGSAGDTAGIIGACATYLYNLKRGMDEIRSGSKSVVLVGNAEAPVVPEVIEGYRVMGALAEDEQLMALDGSTEADHRRACRPFSDNAGFTVAESSVYTLLMDDELALELGANILGSVGEVFVNADGFKKSIPGPGIGNYLTVAKCMAVARAILGEKDFARGTHMQAHGTGTPQNRVTESEILNELAIIFGIQRWPVGAAKAYVGHSMAPAGGDQLNSILGVWQQGLLPGINTISHIADDVVDSNLLLPLSHTELAPDQLHGAFINSKGFGGNNATGFVISPQKTQAMLEKRWGKDRMSQYHRANGPVAQASRDYDDQMCIETLPSIYHFGEGVLEGTDLSISEKEIAVPGFGPPVSLELTNPYSDD